MVCVCNSCSKSFAVDDENVQCVLCGSGDIRRGNDRDIINYIGSSLLLDNITDNN